MAGLERGLGRGLDSLMRSTMDADIPSKDAKRLAIIQLVPGLHQPRKFFDENALLELAASIKNQGVVQPLIVRPKANTSPQMYEIVAGERRWRAAKMAGLTDVPVVITNYSDAEAMTVALVENLQRENLNPLEEAEALQSLRDAHNLSQEDLAAKLGKSRSAVANSMRLLQLPPHLRQGLGEGKLSAGHARAMLAITDDATRDALYDCVVTRELSVRETESAVDCWKKKGQLPDHLLDVTDKSETQPKVSRRAAKPQGLKDLQARLREMVHHGASISGSEEKGRISLPYTSHGELEFLLHLLGMESTMMTSESEDSTDISDASQGTARPQNLGD